MERKTQPPAEAAGMDNLQERHQRILDRVFPKSDSESDIVEALRATRDELGWLRERRAEIEKTKTVLTLNASYELLKRRREEITETELLIEQLEPHKSALEEKLLAARKAQFLEKLHKMHQNLEAKTDYVVAQYPEKIALAAEVLKPVLLIEREAAEEFRAYILAHEHAVYNLGIREGLPSPPRSVIDKITGRAISGTSDVLIGNAVRLPSIGGLPVMYNEKIVAGNPGDALWWPRKSTPPVETGASLQYLLRTARRIPEFEPEMREVSASVRGETP